MPVPNAISDLSQLAGSNYPVGSEAIGNNLDNYLRAHAALIKQSNSVASSTMPSGSTVNVALADAEAVLITGDAFISSLGTGFVGCRRELHLTGNAHFIHSSALQLPSAGNIDGTPGQIFTFRCIAPGIWTLSGSSAGAGLLAQWANINPSAKQNALGFTPVEQAGPTKLSLSWDGTLVGLSLNNAYFGQIPTIPYLQAQYQPSIGYTPANKAGDGFTGDIAILKSVPVFTLLSAGANRGYRHFANISDGADFGYSFQRFNGNDWENMWQVDTAGNLTAKGDVAGLSDERLKSEIRPIVGALDLVKRLQGVRYVKDGKESIGFIAQRYGEVLPELRHIGADGLQSVAYGNTAAVLAEAIKEIDARLEQAGL